MQEDIGQTAATGVIGPIITAGPSSIIPLLSGVPIIVTTIAGYASAGIVIS